MIWLLNLVVRRIVLMHPSRAKSADLLRAKADALISVAESWEKKQKQ